MRRAALLLTSVLASFSLSFALAAPGASAATKTVRLKDSFFSPSRVTIAPGSSVRFVWAGVLAHNLKGAGVPRRYLNPVVRAKPLRVAFRKRGSFRYVCTLHTGMEMTVRVR
jgi:plastocyanin